MAVAVPVFSMQNMASLKYSKQTYKAISVTLNVDITNSIGTAASLTREVQQAYRQEIASVFHKANTRLDRLQSALDAEKIVSPAGIALGNGDIRSVGHFYMSNDWDTLVLDYGRAVAFLQQPTSTLGGARVYTTHLAQSRGLDMEQFGLMVDDMLGNIASMRDSNYVENYLRRYKDFTDELESESEDVADQIEAEAESTAETVNEQIEQTVLQRVAAIEAELSKIEAELSTIFLI